MLAVLRIDAGRFKKRCWPVSEAMLAELRIDAGRFTKRCWPVWQLMLACKPFLVLNYENACLPACLSVLMLID